MSLVRLFAAAPAELARAHAGLLMDLGDGRRAVANSDADLAQRASVRRQVHATQALKSIESAEGLSWLSSLPRDESASAIVELAQLVIGTLAAQKLTHALFADSPVAFFARLSGPFQPLIDRLSRENNPSLLARLAVTLAPHLDSVRAAAFCRMAEVALGHSLSTWEYLGLQDLANLSPKTAANVTLTHADLLCALGGTSMHSKSAEGGARLVADFHRAWQVREPDRSRWWPAPADLNPDSPVDWVAAARSRLASSIVWSLPGAPMNQRGADSTT
jgi:hypothetical protein